MKALKWTLLGVIIVALLLIGSVGLIVATLDPNDYKEQISAKVQSLTGRELSLDGDIRWSLFPWLGLNLGESSLSNAAGFGDQPFASLKEVDIQVALLPLLKKQVVARKVILRGATLNLQKNKSGEDNWSDLANKQDAGENAEGNVDAPDEGSVASDVEIDIHGIDIVDANLGYDDQASGQKLALSALNLSASALRIDQPVKLVSDFKVQLNELAVAIEMAAEVNLDPAGGEYSVTDWVVHQRFSGDAIPGGEQSAVARLDVNVNTGTQVVSVDNLVVELLGLSLEGKLQLSQYSDNLRYTAELASNTFNLRQLMNQLAQPLPDTQDGGAFGSTSIKLDITGGADKLAANPLIFKVDKTRLEGLVSVANFSKPRVTFDLAVDTVDVDGYLPKPGKAAAGSEASAGGAVDDSIALPLELLRSLDVDGNLRVDQLTASKLLFQHANMALKTKGGLLRLAPLSADAYGGSATITASLDARGDSPKYKTNINMSGVQSGDVLQALFDDPIVSGTATLVVDVATQGASVGALKQALNGSIQTKFSEGTIKGSKLSAKIIEARNFVRKLEGKSALENTVTDDTKFSILTATATIDGGTLINKDLSLVAPLFQASGEGTVDVSKEIMDYTLGLGGPPKEGKDTFLVPLKISGPFSDLAFKLALDDVAKDYAKEELQKKEAELKAKADAEKERLKKKVDEEKAKLKAEAKAKEAELKAKADEKIEEKKSELQDKLKKELGNKLENLFK